MPVEFDKKSGKHLVYAATDETATDKNSALFPFFFFVRFVRR